MQSTATQLAAIDALNESGERLTQKAMILNLFETKDTVLTREEIAAHTNLKLSSVCGRVFDLLKDAMLVVRGQRRCPATGLNHELVGLPGAA